MKYFNSFNRFALIFRDFKKNFRFRLNELFIALNYNHKKKMWYPSPSHQGWGSKAIGRNTSIVDAEITPSSPMKPSAGRIIRIVNNMDRSVQVNKR